jgi:hypothetical protein
MTQIIDTTTDADSWSVLLTLTEAIANAGDLPDNAFNTLSDRRLDALDDVMALPGPRADVIRELVRAGVDLRPGLIRAVAGLPRAHA